MTKINASNTPASDAGLHITHTLLDHKDRNILLLVSGGSSLAVLDTIDTDALGEQITVMMVDERFTDKEEGNNFLQLTKTAFYQDARIAGVNFISSEILAGETHEEFTIRQRAAFKAYMKKHTDPYVFGLFGIGNDCHTASIFPKETHEEFDQIYNTDEPYIAINEPNNDYHERTTFTPAFIKEEIDELIVYAAGKQETLLMIQFGELEHLCPALIVINHERSTLFTDAEMMGL